jgi:uncharacterized surface anchored protein
LPEGAYYLVEKQAPVGFIADTDPVHFYLKAGETKEMTLTNTPEEIPVIADSHVLLTHLAANTDALLPGSIFGLYEQGSDKKIGELVTGTDGTAMSAAVTSGNYYLLQLTAPTGYRLNADKISFYLNTGETKALTVYSALDVIPIPTGNLHLTKKAEITGAPLSGAVFGVYDALTKAKVSEITTAADGTAVCELPEGSYYLLESKAPAGFALESSQIPFSIAADNTVKAEVTNMAEKGGVRLTVKDAGGSALEGAVFGVYDACDRKIAELTADKDGKALYEVPEGVYYLLEQDLPVGYSVGSNKYSFYVTTGQTADVLVLKQKGASLPPFEIPKTGEAFPWLNYGMAALCLCMIAVLSGYGLRSRRLV